MRLFVAAWPSEEVLTSLARLPRPERPGVRWSGRDQWHVTLRFFGELTVDEGVVAGRGVADAAAVAQPVVADLGPRVGLLGRGVLQVPVAGLEPVAEALAAATGEVGKPPGPRPFRGHITLARSRRKHGLDELTGVEVRGRWTVGEVALVASVASPRAGVSNRYEVVATFPLG
ncbi:MAG: hypothetical protein KY450_10015 [Actinobacteria bacterium]|nr:hypothetical protein [Actinomycetota bacterium]